MIGQKVKFYKDRYTRPVIILEGLIIDKILLKEADVAITGYVIDNNGDLHCVKCWDLIKIL